jgi:hypothetical protein
MKISSLAAAVIPALGLAAAALAYDGEQYVTCNLDPAGDNWVALKAAPDLRAQRLMKLGPGTFLITTEPYAQGAWRQVIVQRDIQDWSYGGPSGWVHTDYICKVVY